MIKFIKLVLRLAQIAVSFIALYSLTMLLLHNEPFEIFKFREIKGSIIKIEENIKNKKLIYVSYVFKNGNRNVENRIRIGKKWFYDNAKENNIIVFYNTSFPRINYIKNLKMYQGYYIGLVWGLFMLTIFILIDIFADKEKWAKRYRKFFKSL